jgi:1-acyl-sn-glycerol-3-phosphate acyltransferase
MILRFFKMPFKTLLTLFLILLFTVISTFVRLCSRNLSTFRKKQVRVVMFFTSLALKVWNVNVKTVNQPTSEPKEWMLASNHFGFIDAFAIASHFPVLFVTSQEMRETPLIGFLTEIGGCLYVERRHREFIHREKSQLVDALKSGFNVLLYPEGGASDAQEVLPFKRTLMMASAEAGVPLQLICVNFRKVNGEDFSHRWRDHVCWYGDRSFLKHCLLFLSLESVVIEIKLIDQLMLHRNENKDEVSKRTHDLVARHYKKVPIQ